MTRSEATLNNSRSNTPVPHELTRSYGIVEDKDPSAGDAKRIILLENLVRSIKENTEMSPTVFPHCTLGLCGASPSHDHLQRPRIKGVLPDYLAKRRRSWERSPDPSELPIPERFVERADQVGDLEIPTPPRLQPQATRTRAVVVPTGSVHPATNITREPPNLTATQNADASGTMNEPL